MSKFNTMLRVFAILIIICIGMFVTSCRSSNSQAGTWSGTGTIVFLEGAIEVNGNPAEIGDEVPADADIQTGAAALAEIQFGSANIIRIEPDSKLKLNFVLEGTSELTIERGGLSAVLDGLYHLADDGVSMNVRTQTSLAGIRGTSFYVRVEEPQSTYFCLCNGTLDLGAAGQQLDTVQADHHLAFRFVQGTDGIQVLNAPLLYHSDESMDELAEKIGVEIHWEEEE